MKIRKAVIPAAGLGTRFLPATKAQPKEMLPIIDKPTIQFIVEEAVASGIEDILIVTGRGKRAIEDHFDKSYELEAELEKHKKYELLSMMQEISGMANIQYVRQKEALGLGHAILCARRFVEHEPFAVLLGDDVIRAEKPCLQQMMEAFEEHEVSVLGVQPVPDTDVHKYGIVKGNMVQNRLYDVEDLVEKPAREHAPSNLAILGRYIIHHDIFKILEEQQPGAGGEIQLTDSLRTLSKNRKLYAYIFEGKRYDVGDRMGFLEATVDFALEREDLREDFQRYLLSKVKNLA
ncbi:UTP--glucose-1-phosphate uridylyltransferase GalU [Dehalobacterium formicoaceticum]|uniref:UTP--glucose-1-phosphate uridylyltransferase n=1 Tax=Dehalobacterium formicoaceticum TaxID=51515 RepID=A0ABT1Y790_9FIRM|nr:UTP--glucose-1-phosphate uridylyltransferase GalU [Dehalobacterium formicoaceticum]MCR6546413.1 UTP--glucose-1-phosphate uridylyltransferase GalU [Dehalobacterium formicoaceticum]